MYTEEKAKLEWPVNLRSVAINGSVEYTHHDVPVQGRTRFRGSDQPDETRQAANCTVTVSTQPVAPTVTPGDSSRLERSQRNTPPSEGSDDAIGPSSDGSNLGSRQTPDAYNDSHGRKLSPAEERVNWQKTTEQKAEGTTRTPNARTGPKPMGTEGQISHTLSEILPVTLIVFGRLARHAGGGADGAADRLLLVDPYVGLLRWDDRLEDALWQALGWSEWSDYTACSVACGGGVQQRFRHCLPSVAPEHRVASGPRPDGRVTPSPIPPRQPRQDTLNSEIEISTTPIVAAAAAGERTQPLPSTELPGVSIRKSKKQLQSKRAPPVGERLPQTASRARVNEKSTVNGVTGEPVNWRPPAGTQRNRQTVADAGDTWPVCEGHNIEQRRCNAFDCTGTIDLLTTLATNAQWRNWDESIDDRINYEINQLEQNFTLMLSLRMTFICLHLSFAHDCTTANFATIENVSVLRQPPSANGGHLGQHATDDNESIPPSTARSTGGHILSVRSKLTTGSSLSINFETDGHGGLRVLQEKYGLSEMLPVRSTELTLLDGDWHTLAVSGRNGGFVTVYIDCHWINSFVLTKGSIELPQYPTVEVGHNVELRQLTVVPGERSARLQCAPQPVPIHDVENRRVTNFFEHLT
uniref:Laminin G domain-containing protein n=1 Tax=Anopheles dirus TaxID=7168 RepID=A0A182N7A4_9DIPT